MAGEGAAESVLDAASGAQLAGVPSASPEQVESAVTAAGKAFDAWAAEFLKGNLDLAP